MSYLIVRLNKPVAKGAYELNGRPITNAPAGRRVMLPTEQAIEACAAGYAVMLSPIGLKLMAKRKSAAPDKPDVPAPDIEVDETPVAISVSSEPADPASEPAAEKPKRKYKTRVQTPE